LKYPKVSIVLSTYNGERFLKEQIESLLNQTYKNVEIIAIDDRSNDKTVEILKSYGRIKLYQNEKRAGILKNFEKGISLAQGEYIALCDQDDVWYPQKIEIQVKELNKFDMPAMVHSDLEVIDEEGNLLHKSYFKYKGYDFQNTKSLETLISRSGVMGNTVMFNKKLKDLLLPIPECAPMHDYYIGVLNEIYGKRVTLKEPLVKYRLHKKNYGNVKYSKNLLEKIGLFFKEEWPYSERKEFLKWLLTKEIPQEDKKVIEDFLECIENRCLKKTYYKDKPFYYIKLALRKFLKSVK